MSIQIWDSSSLGKRYVREPGSDTVHALFALKQHIVTAYVIYAETANIIRRNRNMGTISRTRFTEARDELLNEILNDVNVTLLSVNDRAILSSIPLEDKHNLIPRTLIL